MVLTCPGERCSVCAGYQLTDSEVGLVSCVAVWLGMYVIYNMI